MLKLFLVIAILSAAQLLADTPAPIDPPKSAAAVSAQEAHDSTIKRAKASYDQAVLMADRKLVDDLEQALHAAMSNGNADEVIRINAAKKAAEVELGRESGGGEDQEKARALSWTVEPGKYAYRYGASVQTIELSPDGSFGPLQRGFQEKWRKTANGILVAREKDELEFFRCSDGVYRGVGPKWGIAIVLSKAG